MNITKTHKSCKNLIEGLERECNKKFPKCLEDIEFIRDIHVYNNDADDILCDSCDVSRKHAHCICGVEIQRIYIFKNTETNKEFNIGSACIHNLEGDIETYNQDGNHFEELYQKWKTLRTFLKNKHKECIKCKEKWSKPRCFHKGLCESCRYNRNSLMDTKILLRRYYGYKLKDMIHDTDYMDFCIRNNTRQSDLFREIKTYFL